MSLRHERRRRWLADDSLASGEDESPVQLAKSKTDSETNLQAYARAAQSNRQRAIHEIVPSHFGSIALVVTVGLALVAVLGLAHLWATTWTNVLNPTEIAALDLDGPRNISRWFASTLLGLASLTAIYVYSLRRHRINDYHGRYRVWIWTALVGLLASLMETTDCAHLGRVFSRRGAELCGLAEGLVWRCAIGTILTLFGLRLLVEIRRSHAAVGTFVISASGFLIAALADLGILSQLSEVNQPLLERASWLIGYVFALSTILLYARHITLEIEGIVAVPPAKVRRSKSRPSAEPADETDAPMEKTPKTRPRSDLEPVGGPEDSRPALQLRVAPAARSQADAPSVPFEKTTNVSQSSLSRADRRRLRRESKMAG